MRKRIGAWLPTDLEHWSPLKRFAALVGLSLFLVALFEVLRLPAAFLLGPMLAGILLTVRGASVTLPRTSVLLAQGMVGMMIAVNLPVAVLPEIARDWPIFLFGTISTIAAAGLLGWLMMRAGMMPGTTAIWGMAPGAASVMTFMSADHGGDIRLVALMQYLRVALCTIAATIVARILGVPVSDKAFVLFPAFSLLGCLLACGLVLLGVWIGVRLRMPGGAMLLPLLLGLAYNVMGFASLALPPWLLAISYAVLGWAIGMRFTGDVLKHAARLFPQLLGSVLALLVLCAVLGVLLSYIAGVDMLTAYLATNPGGADSVAIIAAATKVDVPFVMAMQLARFILVMIAGPFLARSLSRAQQP